MTTLQKLGLGLGAVAMAATLASWNRVALEPEWDGRTFSAWWADLYSLSEPPYSPDAMARRAPAQRAFREMGVSAVPLILARMDAPDTVERLHADEWLTRAGWRRHPFAPGAAEHGRTMFAFQALGPAGADAVPHLRLMLEDPRLTQAAAISLGWIGPASLPALTEAAQHREPFVRYWATIGLGWLNDGARPAVPMLRRAIASERDPQVRCAIAWTLLRVRSELRGSLPVLAALVRAPDEAVSVQVANWLGALGAEAAPALPELRAAPRGATGDVREAHYAAIERIEAGVRTGRSAAGLDVTRR